MGFGSPNLLASIARVAIIGFAVIIAVNQIGIAASLINTLFMGLVFALALAVGLAFGLGGRDTAARMWQGWYQRGQELGPRLEQAAQTSSEPVRQPAEHHLGPLLGRGGVAVQRGQVHGQVAFGQPPAVAHRPDEPLVDWQAQRLAQDIPAGLLEARAVAHAAQAWPEHRPPGEEREGSRARILGYGEIGQGIAQRLRGCGGCVKGVRRQPSEQPGIIGPDEWRDRLPEFDWILVTTALTSHTRHMLGAAEFARMRSSAWLVNVARGRVVDTDALVEALTKESIGGAALDVTDPEPLPDGHPLWDLERCIITPHTADTMETVSSTHLTLPTSYSV